MRLTRKAYAAVAAVVAVSSAFARANNIRAMSSTNQQVLLWDDNGINDHLRRLV